MSTQDVIDYLVGVGIRLKNELGPALSEIYLHGSLINDSGRGFSAKRSDIDLLLTTSLADARERVDFVMRLRPSMQEIEAGLRARLPNRDFLPIASVCVATHFELSEGIHKNRNTRNAFAVEAFRRLDSVEPSVLRAGEPLRADLVQIHFPAWTILADAQWFRSAFVSSKSTGEPEVEVFDDPYLPLPKDLLRSAYLHSCLAERRDPAMVIDDDIAKGFEVLKAMLQDATKVDGREK